MSIAHARVMGNFSQAAAQYDAHADFQRGETQRVYDTALNSLAMASTIADIGCGTGYFAELAARLRPAWHIAGIDLAYGMCREAVKRGPVVQADAARLPLADDSCDAVVSTLCLQWVENLPAVFREITRVLRPGGIAMVASLGGETLHELRRVAAKAVLPLRLLLMREASAYLTAIEQQRLEVLRFEQDMNVRYYAEVTALLDSMRRIGAGASFSAPARGMLGAQRWKLMLREYETLRTSKGIPATWDRLFMILRKPT